MRRFARRRLGKPIDSFLDLRAGDLVVHLSHGIGRYRGIELLDKQGKVEEHLKIEFHGGAKLYVPATKIDLVQKYVGGTKSRPALAKLGGTSWVRQKKAAETAVMDMAAEMLELQARRISRPGIAFAPDGEWQGEFDASFPYRGNARPAGGDPGDQTRHGTAAAHGPLAVRRRRLRQDRGRHAGRLQGGGQRLPGGRARSHDRAGGAALSHFRRADGGVPFRHRPAQPLLFPPGGAGDPGRAGRRDGSTSSSARIGSRLATCGFTTWDW